MGTIQVFVISLFFVAILAVGQGFYWAYRARQEREARELARRLGSLGEGEGPSLFREQARDGVANALGGLGAHLRDSIKAADLNINVGQLLGQCAGVGAVVAIGGLVLLGPTGLVLGPLASLAPYALVRKAGADRARALLEQLPDTLDLMARSLQAGVGLSDSFKLVAEEMPMPIAGEFGRIFEEIRFGREYRDALTKLLERNPGVFDLQLLVSSMLLQRETGGNLIEILDNIAGTVRARFLFEAKLSALTSEAKFSALVLGSLPFGVALMIFLNNPDYLEPMWTDSMGMVMSGIALTIYSLGIFGMNKVSQVEV